MNKFFGKIDTVSELKKIGTEERPSYVTTLTMKCGDFGKTEYIQMTVFGELAKALCKFVDDCYQMPANPLLDSTFMADYECRLREFETRDGFKVRTSENYLLNLSIMSKNYGK